MGGALGKCLPDGGVASELEKMKTDLEKVRKWQDGLEHQNSELKGTVMEQAQSIQNLQRFRERPPARFKKRELFALAAILPFLTLLLLDIVSVSVDFNYVRLAQLTGLTTAVVMIFRLKSNRGHMPEVKELHASPVGSKSAPRAHSLSGVHVGRLSEGDGAGLAGGPAGPPNAKEKETIEKVKAKLRTKNPPNLPESNELLGVQILRFVREHGHGVDNIEKRYNASLHWRNTNLPEIPVAADGGWLSSSEMPNGEFATKYVAIGINAAFCKRGNPVKIERLGKFDLKLLGKTVAEDPTARPRFNNFYLGLIEFLQRKLDQYSVEQGRLVQTYEIFDLDGLQFSVFWNRTVLDFLNDVLLNFSTHYPSSFQKACLLNCPSWMPKLWGIVSMVLPKSVTAKVLILGKDYEKLLQEDLTPEALAWVASTHQQLIRAPHPGVLK